MKKYGFGVIGFLCLFGCEKQPISKFPTPVPVDITKIERPNYLQDLSIESFLNAPILEIPEPKVEPNWKVEKRAKGLEFYIPEAIQMSHEHLIDSMQIDPIRITRKTEMFKKGEFRINFTVYSNITLADFFQGQHRSGGYKVSVVRVNRVKQPRNGYFIEQNQFGDYVYELLIDGGKDTYGFYVVRPVRGTERGPKPTQISDDDCRKILFSLKLTGAHTDVGG